MACLYLFEDPEGVAVESGGHGDLLVPAEFRTPHGADRQTLQIELNKRIYTFLLPSMVVSRTFSPNLMVSYPPLACSTDKTFLKLGLSYLEEVTAYVSYPRMG